MWKIISSNNILQRHITNIHCEEETILCEECGKFMSSKNILQRHMTNIHIHCEGEEEIKPFCCKECGKVMESKNILQRHIANMHREEETISVKNVENLCQARTFYKDT